MVASSSWLVWEGIFHRFGRCPNHDDFLEECIFHNAPKLLLVTLAPFGPSGGALFVVLRNTKFVFSLWISNEFPVWHPRFVFSLRISNEFYVLAPQFHVFAKDF